MFKLSYFHKIIVLFLTLCLSFDVLATQLKAGIVNYNFFPYHTGMLMGSFRVLLLVIVMKSLAWLKPILNTVFTTV